MSEITDSATISINEQEIEVSTTIHPTMKTVRYVLTSKVEIDPQTVAATLYLMCHDLCEKLGIEFESLREGIISEEDYH